MNIKVDSRKVEKGDTFIALRGIGHDGHNYIKEAIQNGASKIIAEEMPKDIGNIPFLFVEDTHEYLAYYLKENYYKDIKDLKLIGITGTNGKTTTGFLLYEALYLLHHKCAYIGTIGFYIEGKRKDLNNTTPDILDLYEMLLEARKEGCEYVVMEVSSHALSYKRVEGLLFDYAIFTNLTQDHLDYHKTMENYALAKQQLFTKLKKEGKAILNKDDPYCKYFIREDNQNVFYGFTPSDYHIIDYHTGQIESVFRLKMHKKMYEFKTTLLGKYNIYNLVACIGTLSEMGFDIGCDIIEQIKPPLGRMDKIRYNDNTIIIDYAHTPDAVEKVIQTAREMHPHKIYVIIGCGGNRDKRKRPLMAQIATHFGDYAIFTSDNPRYENPKNILKDMIENLEVKNYEIVENRREAIKKGIQLLSKNDILLLLGKGHETYQIINGEKSYFDDKQVVLEFM